MILSREEFKKMAEGFAIKLHPNDEHATLILLKGDLGAGKTTFVQDVARALGAQDRVQSPTFVIEKRYTPTSGPFERVIHIDAYRLDGGDELKRLGFEEILKNSKNLIFLEWPERVADVLPEWASTIEFRFVDEERREVGV